MAFILLLCVAVGLLVFPRRMSTDWPVMSSSSSLKRITVRPSAVQIKGRPGTFSMKMASSETVSDATRKVAGEKFNHSKLDSNIRECDILTDDSSINQFDESNLSESTIEANLSQTPSPTFRSAHNQPMMRRVPVSPIKEIPSPKKMPPPQKNVMFTPPRRPEGARLTEAFISSAKTADTAVPKVPGIISSPKMNRIAPAPV